MAAIPAQVGDLVELIPSPANEGAVGLHAVRYVKPNGGYVVSLVDNPGHLLNVVDNDIARVYLTTSSGGTIQNPTEAVLVSGVDATLGEVVQVTITAARVVGAPLKATKGQQLEFTFIQGGAGAFAITWNAIFKKTWADTGNATGARSSIRFRYDGTNWNQIAAQSPYV